MTSQHATIVCTRYTDWLTPEAAKIGVTVTPLAPQEFSVTRADGADLDPNIRVSTNSRFYTGHPVVMRTVSAKEARFLFPDDLVSGDYVEIWFEGFVAKATTTAQGVAVTSLTTPAPPAQTQSPTTPGDRRLVVWEGNTASPDHGRFFALQPGQASGIALPTFRVGASRPPVATVEGESFYETTTQRGFVWDGSTWRDVTPSAILRYPNDAALVADQTQGVGAYGVSGTTGNLYVYTTTGWKPIGTQEYPTVAGLLADTPAIGTLALAMDEGSEWEYLSTGWNCTSLRHLPTTADVLAWTDPGNSHVGDRALAADKEVQYIRTSGGWKPASPYEEAEAVIRADVSWPLNGQEAISRDTGQIFVFVNGQWMEDPIQHYPTEQDLLAATPPVGTVAFADDNGLFYGRISGGWRRANSPTSSVGAHPANPADGDLNFRPNSGLQVYAGSSWQPVGGTPPGTIIMFPSWTSPPGYILCDGRAIPASATKAIALVGAHTPDLRGQFIRGSNSTQDTKGLTRHEDTTRRPRHHAFTGSTNWAGIHWHTLFKLRWHGLNDGGGYSDLEYQNSNNSDQDSAAPRTNNSGNHVHTVTVTGGGDSETAPVHVKLAFHMKL